MSTPSDAGLPPYDADEREAVAALTADDVSAIDSALLQNVAGGWRKVAWVVIGAMNAYPDRYDDLPDHYYGRRVLELVRIGRLEAQGDVASMRASEVRLPRD